MMWVSHSLVTSKRKIGFSAGKTSVKRTFHTALPCSIRLAVLSTGSA
jgi:hypothetical protein